jgi:hypothetical protein
MRIPQHYLSVIPVASQQPTRGAWSIIYQGCSATASREMDGGEANRLYKEWCKRHKLQPSQLYWNGFEGMFMGS